MANTEVNSSSTDYVIQVSFSGMDVPTGFSIYPSDGTPSESQILTFAKYLKSSPFVTAVNAIKQIDTDDQITADLTVATPNFDAP